MIDRLWAQWQLVSSQNALSFEGGSVPARETYASYQTYPNGGPPFLDVGLTHLDTFYRDSPLVTQPGSVLPSDGLWTNVTVFDLMNTKSKVLCYTYE